MAKRARKITPHDRQVFRRNALKGTEKWKRTPRGVRREERARRRPKWGFDGRSPRTRPRKYKRSA